MKGTFVEGIGPPLEQIEKDYAATVAMQNGGPTPERDALVLVRELLQAKKELAALAAGGPYWTDDAKPRALIREEGA